MFLFQKEKGIEFHAVSLPSLLGRDINRFANDLFEARRIGAQTGGRGLLFVLAVEEKLVRLEVSYQLEPIYTDAFVSYIEHEQMAPFFKEGRIGDGFEATLELIVQRAQEQIQEGAYQPEEDKKKLNMGHLTGGGGAKMDLAISPLSSDQKKTLPEEVRALFAAQGNPEATFTLYLERTKRHIRDPDLGIFTPESRDFLRRWTVTNAQLDHESHSYSGKSYEVRSEGDQAVIRFPITDRSLSPFFLKKNPEGWQMDVVTMSQLIRFNHRNEWHFAEQSHPYLFAFKDCILDESGYPFLRSSTNHRPTTQDERP